MKSNSGRQITVHADLVSTRPRGILSPGRAFISLRYGFARAADSINSTCLGPVTCSA